MSERRHGRIDFLGENTPYSKGLMARVLAASGLPSAWTEELREAWWADHDPTAAPVDQTDGAVPVSSGYA